MRDEKSSAFVQVCEKRSDRSPVEQVCENRVVPETCWGTTDGAGDSGCVVCGSALMGALFSCNGKTEFGV